jgi:hypothetical protein
MALVAALSIGSAEKSPVGDIRAQLRVKVLAVMAMLARRHDHRLIEMPVIGQRFIWHPVSRNWDHRRNKSVG